MQKAVFLDRDGVINDNSKHYYVFKDDQLVYNPDVLDVIKSFYDAGYLVIVISNQGGVSRGLYETKDVDVLHEKIKKDVEAIGGKITDFYFCPHHDKVEKCLCRKPSSLLIERAAAAYDVDLAASYLIGDSERDVEAGNNAGLNKSFKVEANGSCKDIIAQIVAE
ncbi:MAG: HAD family hydrolase [Salinivirgaceae bacterium]|nr:MAG: HAD family hydrolase [Salinivirgaceae bacterium]